MPFRLIALLLFSCCQSVYSDPIDIPDPIDVELPSFSCIGMKESIRLPKKLPLLLQLGKLHDEKTVQVTEWDAFKTIEKLYSFKGLHLQVITFTNDPDRYLLGTAFIESSEWNVSPLRVGSPVASLIPLGVKNPSPNGTWHFYGEADSLYVKVRAGKVTRVVYQCYTG